MDECYICQKKYSIEYCGYVKNETNKWICICNNCFDDDDNLRVCICCSICKYYFSEEEPICWCCAEYDGSNEPKDANITEDERYALLTSEQEKPLVSDYNLESKRELYGK